MDALDVLNEDCWRLIFGMVDHSDWKTLSDTCFTFQQILSRDKCVWIFPEIIPHLMNYLLLPPYSSEERWKEGMLGGRLVCKQWRDSIDNHLQNHDNRSYTKRGHPCSLDLYHRDLNKMMEKISDHQVNPFLRRKVSLYYNPFDDEFFEFEGSSYIRKMYQVLEKFGSKIYEAHFSLIYGRHRLSPLEDYKHIRRILTCCTNLRKLSFSGDMISVGRDREEAVEEVNAFRAEHPLPDRPHLQELVCDIECATMTHTLLEGYAPQLMKLYSVDACFLLESHVGRMSRMVELDLFTERSSDTFHVLRTLQSPLHKLTCNLTCRSGKYFWSVDDFLRNIQHLSQLKHLKIITRAFVGEAVPIPSTLTNDSITHLEIECVTDGINTSFNFLGCLKKLEEVRVECPSEEKYIGTSRNNVPEEIWVRYYLLWNQMYKSNMWEVIPTLKYFRFAVGHYWKYEEVHEYTRAEYQKRKDAVGLGRRFYQMMTSLFL